MSELTLNDSAVMNNIGDLEVAIEELLNNPEDLESKDLLELQALMQKWTLLTSLSSTTNKIMADSLNQIVSKI